MIRGFFLALLLVSVGYGQFAIMSPVAASTLTGSMTFTVTNVPTGTVEVEYVYDGFREAGTATNTPWSLLVKTGYEWMDGSRTLTATAKGANGAVLGTTAGVQFSINNFGASGFSFSRVGTSGTINLTLASAPAGSTVYCMIDGLWPDAPFIDIVNSPDYWDQTNDWITWAKEIVFATGDPIYYQGNIASSPLVNNTTYYAIVIDRYRFRLATSRVNALAGTYIDLGAFAVGSSFQKFTRYLGTDTWFNNAVSPRTYDSTRLVNGTHIQTCNAWRGTVDNTYFTSDINPVASYSESVTINNGVAPMELRGPSQLSLVTGGTYQLALFMANTDESVTVLATPTIDYFSSNTAVATVSSTGLVTAVSPGRAWIRTRYNNASYAHDIAVTVQSGVKFKHFSRGGSILDTYVAGTSTVPVNLFELKSIYWESNPSYKLGETGINTSNESLPPDIATNTTTFPAWWSAYFTPIESRLVTYDLGSMWNGDDLIGTGLARQWGILYTPAIQANLDTALTSLVASNRATYKRAKDEVDSTWKSPPSYLSTWATTQPQGGSFSSITVASGVLTVNYISFPDWTVSASGNITACITGATTSALNKCYVVTAKVRSNFTMQRTTAADGTYDVNTDPNLRIAMWQDYFKQETSKTVTSDGAQCTVPITSAAANGWTVGSTVGVFGTPADTNLRNYWVILDLPDANTIRFTCDVAAASYGSMTVRLMFSPTLPYNTLQLYSAQYAATTGSVMPGYPSEAVAVNFTIEQWNQSNVSGYFDLYTTFLLNDGLPSRAFSGKALRELVSTISNRFTVWNIDHPLVYKLNNVNLDYEKKVAGDYFRYGTDLIYALGTRVDMVTAEMWASIALGASGLSGYFFDVPSKQTDRKNLAINGRISVGTNPLWTPEIWKGVSLGALLVNRLKEMVLSPVIADVSYGSKFLTGARGNNSSKMFIISSFSEKSETVSIDLTPFVMGGKVTRWKINTQDISVSEIAGGTDSLTLGTGETAIYLFSSSATSIVKTMTVYPVLISGATSSSIRYSVYPSGLEYDANGVNCTTSCTFTYDPELPLYTMTYQKDAGGNVISRSAIGKVN